VKDFIFVYKFEIFNAIIIFFVIYVSVCMLAEQFIKLVSFGEILSLTHC